jgi:hypothetical protein
MRSLLDHAGGSSRAVRGVLSLALLAGACSVWAAGPPARLSPAEARARELDLRIMAEAAKGSQVLARLTYLCDEIGPRLTGSPALERASKWTAEEMKKVGLSNVHLEPWIAPEGWQRGKAVARLIEPGNGRSISLASMGWRPGTRGKIVGDVVIIKAETLKELNAYKGKLKNAIVLQRAPTKVRELDKVDQQGALGRAMRPDRARTNYREMQEVRRAMTDFLMKEGVAAVLQDAGKPLGLLVTTGGWGRRDQLPSLFVAHNHYEMLWRLAGRPSPARTRMELEVTNETIPGPIKVYNTVGEIPGTDKTRDEVVVVGAHLDSWDLGQGATDNGTGSTVVLEAARVLVKSGIKPKRTIRFILFTGEEQGLHGSRAYVKEHADEMKRVSAALVHDTGTGRVIGVGVGGRPKAQEILQRELASLQAVGLKDFRRPSLGGGSDHASFNGAGVPGFLMVQEPAGYYLTHHTQADTVDRAREKDLIQGVQVLAVSAARIANLDEMLPRESGAGRRRRPQAQ